MSKDFYERRRLMLDAVSELVIDHPRPWLNQLYRLVSWGGDIDKESLAEHFGSDLNVWNAFIASIAVSESDGKRPSYWQWEKGGNFEGDNRKVVKWATFIKMCVRMKLLPEDFPIEVAATFLGEHWPTEGEFTFKEKDDVVATYDRECFGSCMHGKPYTAWYQDNADVVKLIGIYEGGRYVGRALLWTAENDEGETVKYLDRVYPSDGGRHSHAAKAWAASNGWLYKKKDNYEDEDNYCLTVRMSPSRHGYPYCDTFKYALLEDGGITLSTCGGARYSHCLDSTSGDGPGYDSVCCERCDNHVSVEDTFTVYVGQYATEEWCSDCVGDSATFIQDRRSVASDEYIDDERVLRLADDTPVAEWDEVSLCDVTGGLFFSEDMTFTSLSERYICDDRVVTTTCGETLGDDELAEYGVVENEDGEYVFVKDMVARHDLDGEDDELIEFICRKVHSGSYTLQEAVRVWVESHGQFEILTVEEAI